MDINCKQINTCDSENIKNNVTEERYQEMESERDIDDFSPENFMNNAIEDRNEEMEVEPVVDNSINNETVQISQNVDVPVQLEENSEEIDNGMEVSIETEEGSGVNLTHLDPLLGLLNKKTSPFANNVGVLTPERKRLKNGNYPCR